MEIGLDARIYQTESYVHLSLKPKCASARIALPLQTTGYVQSLTARKDGRLFDFQSGGTGYRVRESPGLDKAKARVTFNG